MKKEKLKIVKPFKSQRIYEVQNEKGEVMACFDSYNYQKPLTWAKKFINSKPLE